MSTLSKCFYFNHRIEAGWCLTILRPSGSKFVGCNADDVLQGVWHSRIIFETHGSFKDHQVSDTRLILYKVFLPK